MRRSLSSGLGKTCYINSKETFHGSSASRLALSDASDTRLLRLECQLSETAVVESNGTLMRHGFSFGGSADLFKPVINAGCLRDTRLLEIIFPSAALGAITLQNFLLPVECSNFQRFHQ